MCSRLKGVPLKAVILWTSLIAWSLSKEQMNALHVFGKGRHVWLVYYTAGVEVLDTNASLWAFYVHIFHFKAIF